MYTYTCKYMCAYVCLYYTYQYRAKKAYEWYEMHVRMPVHVCTCVCVRVCVCVYPALMIDRVGMGTSWCFQQNHAHTYIPMCAYVHVHARVHRGHVRVGSER